MKPRAKFVLVLVIIAAVLLIFSEVSRANKRAEISDKMEVALASNSKEEISILGAEYERNLPIFSFMSSSAFGKKEMCRLLEDQYAGLGEKEPRNEKERKKIEEQMEVVFERWMKAQCYDLENEEAGEPQLE